MEILENVPDRPHQVIGPVKARVTSKTLFSKDRTIEDVNAKLATTAQEMGANGVIGVQYNRGVSFTSWKALTATGTAVVFGAQPPPNATQAAPPVAPSVTAAPAAPFAPPTAGTAAGATKACPDCAESIDGTASTCPHCGYQFA